MQWKGLFVVDSKVSSNNNSLKVGNKSKIFHINLFKKYHRREDDSEQVQKYVACDAVKPVQLAKLDGSVDRK